MKFSMISKIKSISKKIKEFFLKENMKELFIFIWGIIAYGFLINFMLWGITTTTALSDILFTWKFLAYGILYYIIAKEMPPWWLQMRSRIK